MIDKVSLWLTRLFEQYKLVRRLTVMGVFFMIMFVSMILFTNLSNITTPVAAAYGTLCGLLAVVFKFYGDSRDKDK